LNRAIEVLVIDCVIVMPDSRRRVCHFVPNECKAIVSRIWLDLVDNRPRPGPDGRIRPHRRSDRRKGETGRAADIETAIGSIVVLVALPGI
jgi:hypothetical protein